jgi:hypothetical protein
MKRIDPWLGSMPLAGAAVALAAVLMASGPATAGEGDPCKKGGKGIAVPQCQTATHADHLNHDRTTAFGLSCPAEAPYYWEGWSDTFTSRWHVITENLVVENRHTAHFTVSDTQATGSLDFTVTIGCSPLSETGTCSGAGQRTGDPGCPESNRRAVCIPDEGGADCWAEWNETCVNNNVVTSYFCTDASFVPTCYTCSG